MSAPHVLRCSSRTAALQLSPSLLLSPDFNVEGLEGLMSVDGIVSRLLPQKQPLLLRREQRKKQQGLLHTQQQQQQQVQQQQQQSGSSSSSSSSWGVQRVRLSYRETKTLIDENTNRDCLLAAAAAAIEAEAALGYPQIVHGIWQPPDEPPVAAAAAGTAAAAAATAAAAAAAGAGAGAGEGGAAAAGSGSAATTPTAAATAAPAAAPTAAAAAPTAAPTAAAAAAAAANKTKGWKPRGTVTLLSSRSVVLPEGDSWGGAEETDAAAAAAAAAALCLADDILPSFSPTLPE
ncbi:uncharacterized protein EMH_0081340 [Eimeria mitis]|uniref:Uncharacterized protein n=1 Tax=Eimeria mitis TaxID=44415 RepID=U6K5Q3_9EIME|nr:uncharacterized protein EMH_0081340 [Eimeria mitis]CDJ33260.1 hypothetical protein EMH_0081340 [Eimeria mitis]